MFKIVGFDAGLCQLRTRYERGERHTVKEMLLILTLIYAQDEKYKAETVIGLIFNDGFVNQIRACLYTFWKQKKIISEIFYKLIVLTKSERTIEAKV